MAALDQFGIRATAPVNAAVCARYPALVAEALRRGWEFAGHGLDMGRPSDSEGGDADEAAMIVAALGAVRRATGQPVIGWLSPGNSESLHTLDHLAAADIKYVCDWGNDELPYPLRTRNGAPHAMPYAHDVSDVTMMWQGHHSPTEFADQVIAQFDWLHAESSARGCRVFTLSLHSWCIGQPHRIGALRRILVHIAAHDGVWIATGAEILAGFQSAAEP